VIVTPLAIPEVLRIEPRLFTDARGHFGETFRADRYAELGVVGPFIQDNVAYSRRGVLRGLHLQHPRPQAKLVSVMRGTVLDVAVDVRVGSPTFGRWASAELSDENHHQIYIPRGFAHGVLVLSDDAIVAYKCSDYYAPDAELCVRWNDPAIGITWPIAEPIVSTRDASAPLLAEIAIDRLPR
jgi:dTDP-4-dehydrorhamnose 3,5-epimerase